MIWPRLKSNQITCAVCRSTLDSGQTPHTHPTSNTRALVTEVRPFCSSISPTLSAPNQPISVAVDLRSCASGFPACTAGCNRSCASRVESTCSRSPKSVGDAAVQDGPSPVCPGLRKFHRGSPRIYSTLPCPSPSTLRIGRGSE